MTDSADRRKEWFVPSFGPLKFRVFIGLLFLPYTGMVLANTVIGAALARDFDKGLAGGLIVVHFLALGIAAHALDALGSHDIKPWGVHFQPVQLWALTIISLIPATAIGIFYAVNFAPLLWPIGLLEFFFLFAYNLEWFNGRFHTDGWFAFSWGMLPVVAGYILQTNRFSLILLPVSLATGLFSLVEITASRPYKAIKRSAERSLSDEQRAKVYERILKSISLGVILLGVSLLILRLRWPSLL